MNPTINLNELQTAVHPHTTILIGIALIVVTGFLLGWYLRKIK